MGHQYRLIKKKTNLLGSYTFAEHARDDAVQLLYGLESLRCVVDTCGVTFQIIFPENSTVT